MCLAGRCGSYSAPSDPPAVIRGRRREVEQKGRESGEGRGGEGTEGREGVRRDGKREVGLDLDICPGASDCLVTPAIKARPRRRHFANGKHGRCMIYFLKCSGLAVVDRVRKCADTIGTVPVPLAGHFQC